MFKIEKPIIVLNFKTYKESTNDEALKLAKICESVSDNLVICVDTIDLKYVAQNVSIPVFAQHVDGVEYGGFTGKILPDVLKNAGIKGSLINHSEDRYEPNKLKLAIDSCKAKGIFSLVCVQDKVEAINVAKLGPDAIAIEPPELIGGNVSVTSANPEIVSDTVSEVHKINPNIPVLCGAGVKTKEDIKKAIELGAKGVLLASGVTKSSNPEETLKDMIKGLN